MSNLICTCVTTGNSAQVVTADPNCPRHRPSNPIIVTTLADALTVIAIREREIERLRFALADIKSKAATARQTVLAQDILEIARKALSGDSPSPVETSEKQT